MIERYNLQGDSMHYNEAELVPFGSLDFNPITNYGITRAEKRSRKGAKGGSGSSPKRTEEVYLEDVGATIIVPTRDRLTADLLKIGYNPNVAAGMANQIRNAFLSGNLASLNTQPILKDVALRYAQEDIEAQVSQVELERLQNVQSSIGTDAELASQYLESTAAGAAALAESERQRMAAEAAEAEARFKRNRNIAIGILGVSVLGYLGYKFTR
jgi:hypothetical protein